MLHTAVEEDDRPTAVLPGMYHFASYAIGMLRPTLTTRVPPLGREGIRGRTTKAPTSCIDLLLSPSTKM
eukprot:2532853-Pyramimonas_sp.AAC.1